MFSSPCIFNVIAGYQPLMRVLGLDGQTIFSDPRIKVWRDITERENCTLDGADEDGRAVRLHIKRFRACSDRTLPAAAEAAGIGLLLAAGIPTTPLVGWGQLADRRSFLITRDMADHLAADKLIAQGERSFEQLLEPTVGLAAGLHAAGLHHRDLYLCHFFVHRHDPSAPISLIDAARVRPLPGWPWRRRWIVKDLAQFWYSAQQLGTDQSSRRRWLERYAQLRQIDKLAWLARAVEGKAGWIARHDRALRKQQPMRNVSIPQTPVTLPSSESNGDRVG